MICVLYQDWVASDHIAPGCLLWTTVRLGLQGSSHTDTGRKHDPLLLTLSDLGTEEWRREVLLSVLEYRN